MQIGDVVSDDLVQAVTFIVCLIGIVVWFRWGRGRFGYAVAPIAFLVHRAAFYVAITLDPMMDNAVVVMWSSAISLHSVITLALAAVLMIAINRRSARI